MRPVCTAACKDSRYSRGMDTPTPPSTDRSQRQRQVVDALMRVLPPQDLLWHDESLAPFECDGLSAYRERPMVVAMPRTHEQVGQVLKVCHALQVPVVARGGGTGLSGGALPHAMGVTLSLARLNQIVQIDPLARVAVVQCGVRNLAISEAAAPHGLYYAPDPSSQIACTIGGNVAENAGGVHCLKYGLTVHNVLQVRGFSIEGEPFVLGSHALDAPGLDLLAAFMGSEGLLGVVTEVTVRLLPRPQVARCVLASFDDVAKAGDAVAAIIGAGLIPAGLEMMDQPMTLAVEDFVKAGYDLDAKAILLLESDGTPEEVEEEIGRLGDVLKQAGATHWRVSDSEAQRLQFWSGRKNAFPATGRISPDYLCMDASIPRKALATMLQAIEGMQTTYGLRCVNVFHAGDGNMHPLILFNANDPAQLKQAEAFGNDILRTAVSLGGTITGEHGVGVEKLDAMCVQFTDQEREQMLAFKAAFDPSGLLNPGKAVPMLARCGEVRGVRRSQALSQALGELPRY